MAERAENLSIDGDVVTIGLYATQTRAGQFEGFIDDQIKQIEYIRQKLSEAAIAAGKAPPKFIISTLVVPNWDIPNNSYENPDYLAVQQEFFSQFQRKLHDHASPFVLENAYLSATNEEKKFLHDLRNLGAIADWIKTHAIVRNHDRAHLQLDSNTQILDFNFFWARTFGQRQHDAIHDGLNASAYDPSASYITA